MPTSTMRVVRVDRHAVHVMQLDGEALSLDDPGSPDVSPGVRVAGEPQRVELDRDGLVPAVDGERHPPTVGDVVVVGERHDGAPHLTRLEPRRTTVVRGSAGGSSRTQVLAANVDVVLVAEHL